MNLHLKNFIQYLLIFSLTPIFYSLIKIIYGDIYFKNLPIFLTLISLFSSFLFLNSKKINHTNINGLKILFLSIVIILIVLINTRVLLYNTVQLLLFYFSILLTILTDKRILNFFCKKELYIKVFNYSFYYIFLFFIFHIISYMYHVFTDGNDILILTIFEIYDWLPENISLTFLLLVIILRYKFNFIDFRVEYLRLVTLYFSVVYNTWIITVLIFSSYTFDLLKYIFMRKNLEKLKITSLCLTSLFILISFFKNDLLNFENFFTKSIGYRLNEFQIGYTNLHNIFNYDYFFDDYGFHSILALMFNYYGIYGICLIIVILFFNLFWFNFSKFNGFFFIVQFFFFLELFTRTTISPFFIIFYLISYHNSPKD